ncbi:hypothetical protein I4U23_010853 [Adineta vaga]|nr:hypothetical protein I4U23_010853 [Adineta vaga]
MYRFSFFIAAQRHILSTSTSITDGTNNRSPSRWRYEKYMYECVFIGQLKHYLQLLQTKSIAVTSGVLPQIDRLMKKLTVLIAICTVYICIESVSGEVNVNNIHFINMINTKTKQHIFFDVFNSDLLTGLKALKEESQITGKSFVPIPDDMRIGPTIIGHFL